MGLLKGTANLVRFKLKDGEDPVTDEYVRERITSFAFQDIDDTYDTYSIGWVNIYDLLEGPIVGGGLDDPEHIFILLRIDERKIPGATLQKFIGKEEARVKAEKQIPKIGRAMKLEIKGRITAQLEREVRPAPTTAELFWDRGKREVLFFANQPGQIAVLEDMFKETFGLTLIRQIPFIIADEITPEGKGKDLLNTLSPTRFA